MNLVLTPEQHKLLLQTVMLRSAQCRERIMTYEKFLGSGDYSSQNPVPSDVTEAAVRELMQEKQQLENDLESLIKTLRGK